MSETSTALVVYDEDFALDQLERLMRAPHLFSEYVNLGSIRGKRIKIIEENSVKDTNIVMSRRDLRDFMAWANTVMPPAPPKRK